jgi:hypothetical protein
MGVNRRDRSEKHAQKCGEYAARLIEPLRARARELGYALGVHGSLAYDIDLIAAPWTNEAVGARHLAEALRLEAERVHGFAYDSDAASSSNPHYFNEGCPRSHPHGRLAWTFHLGGGPYIDLSVLPKGEESNVQYNIFAYTAPNPDYPEFVSVNRHDDGKITIAVRGPKMAPGSAGNAHSFDMPGYGATMVLPAERLPDLIKSLQGELARSLNSPDSLTG